MGRVAELAHKHGENQTESDRDDHQGDAALLFRNEGEEFRSQPQGPLHQGLSLTDVKEFTYWLFKSRLSIWDPARVASDTRKGIHKLRALESIDDPELRRAEIYGILTEGSLPTDYPTKTTRYSGKR